MAMDTDRTLRPDKTLWYKLRNLHLRSHKQVETAVYTPPLYVAGHIYICLNVCYIQVIIV